MPTYRVQNFVCTPGQKTTTMPPQLSTTLVLAHFFAAKVRLKYLKWELQKHVTLKAGEAEHTVVQSCIFRGEYITFACFLHCFTCDTLVSPCVSMDRLCALQIKETCSTHMCPSFRTLTAQTNVY